MYLRRLKAIAAATFLAAAPCAYGDTHNPESVECTGSAESAECPEPSAPGSTWEDVKREGGEAIGALKGAAGDAAKKLWSTTRERTEDAVGAARDATGEAVGAARDATGEAVEHAAEEGRQAWDATREKSRELWRRLTEEEGAETGNE